MAAYLDAAWWTLVLEQLHSDDKVNYTASGITRVTNSRSYDSDVCWLRGEEEGDSLRRRGVLLLLPPPKYERGRRD